MNLSGKKVAVLGAGKSGLAACRLVRQLKGQPMLSDANMQVDLPDEFQNWLNDGTLIFEKGQHSEEFLLKSQLIVISPGIKTDIEPLALAYRKGIPVVGEMELASWYCSCPIIAVTGSNGKTTTVHLIKDILKQAGKEVILCGNVGEPFADYVLSLKETDYVVLEVSSFQLESILEFHPHIAVFLNLSQNHLDRHTSMQEYFALKKKIFMNQQAKDFAVLNAQDEWSKSCSLGIRSQATFFNSEEQRSQTGLDNPNYLAAFTVAKILVVDENLCHRTFAEFKGIEHRLEWVRNLAGIDYINDSKSTTAEATRWALERVEKPVLLICGGRDKNIDFSNIRSLVQKRVKQMILFGEAKEKLKLIFENDVPCAQVNNLDAAVEFAKENANEGDCILLSPMCTSFDMFKNYEERGEVFKGIVHALS